MKRIATALIYVLVAAAATALTLYSGVLSAQGSDYHAPPVNTSLIERPDPQFALQRLNDHAYQCGPVKIVHVWGSPREMGLQQGRAVAADIRAVRDQYLVKHVTEEQGYTREYQLRCAQAMLKHIPPAYIEEMHGIAEGAGVSYDDILLLHTHADMVHFGKEWGQVHRGRDRKPESLCSNFIVFGSCTPDGRLLHGRNLDWSTGTGVQDHATVLIAEPDEGVPYALVTYAGAAGAVTGMNAEGITFGEMTSSTADETLDGLPLFFICRHILQDCRDLDEVSRLVKSYPATTGWNFMIGDGEARDGRAYEVDAAGVEVFRPNDRKEDDRPVSWPIKDAIRRTNHPCSRAVQQRAADRIGTNLAMARAVVLGVPSVDTWPRYVSLGEWIEQQRGRIDARLARAFLQSGPVAGGGNLHSVVFDPQDLTMWVANATSGENRQPAWSQPYVKVELKRFLGKRPAS